MYVSNCIAGHGLILNTACTAYRQFFASDSDFTMPSRTAQITALVILTRVRSPNSSLSAVTKRFHGANRCLPAVPSFDFFHIVSGLRRHLPGRSPCSSTLLLTTYAKTSSRCGGVVSTKTEPLFPTCRTRPASARVFCCRERIQASRSSTPPSLLSTAEPKRAKSARSCRFAALLSWR